MAFLDPERRKEYQRVWVALRKAKWLKANGPCKECGSNKRLEVDHIDQAKKTTHRIWSWSKDRREKELANCQPLCYKCHKVKTSSQRPDKQCGTNSMYTTGGCRCQDCRRAHSLANQSYKAGPT